MEEANQRTGPIAATAIQQNPLRGIAAMLAGGICFAVTDALVKWVSPRFPASEIIFFRSLFALMPISAMAAWQGRLAALKTVRLVGHAARSLCGLISLFCFVYAFGHMPLADAIG